MNTGQTSSKFWVRRADAALPSQRLHFWYMANDETQVQTLVQTPTYRRRRRDAPTLPAIAIRDVGAKSNVANNASASIAAVTLVKLSNPADLLPRRSAPLKITAVKHPPRVSVRYPHTLLRPSTMGTKKETKTGTGTETDNQLGAVMDDSLAASLLETSAWLLDESLARCASPALSALSSHLNQTDFYPVPVDTDEPTPITITPLTFTPDCEPSLSHNNDNSSKNINDDDSNNDIHCSNSNNTELPQIKSIDEQALVTWTDQVQSVVKKPPADVVQLGIELGVELELGIRLGYSASVSQNAPIDFECLTINNQQPDCYAQLPESTVDDAVLEELPRINGRMLFGERSLDRHVGMRRSVAKTVTFAFKNPPRKASMFERFESSLAGREEGDEPKPTLSQEVEASEAPLEVEERLKSEEAQVIRVRRKTQLASREQPTATATSTSTQKPKAKRAAKVTKTRRVRKKSRPVRVRKPSETRSSEPSDDDWFSKYCVIQPPIAEICAQKFKEMDPWKEGYVTLPVAVEAIRAVNQHIRSDEQQYLHSLLQVLSYEGYINELLFTVISALSFRIASLE